MMMTTIHLNMPLDLMVRSLEGQQSTKSLAFNHIEKINFNRITAFYFLNPKCLLIGPPRPNMWLNPAVKSTATAVWELALQLLLCS
jgi:hypothetical protein